MASETDKHVWLAGRDLVRDVPISVSPAFLSDGLAASPELLSGGLRISAFASGAIFSDRKTLSPGRTIRAWLRLRQRRNGNPISRGHPVRRTQRVPVRVAARIRYLLLLAG